MFFTRNRMSVIKKGNTTMNEFQQDVTPNLLKSSMRDEMKRNMKELVLSNIEDLVHSNLTPAIQSITYNWNFTEFTVYVEKTDFDVKTLGAELYPIVVTGAYFAAYDGMDVNDINIVIHYKDAQKGTLIQTIPNLASYYELYKLVG